MKKVVVIGGGTGTFTVLQGLKKYPLDITAIISMADDGGSTGMLRDELGVLPPGDLRQALVALSNDAPVLRDLFNYRFEDGALKGHNFGNLLISALEKVTGSSDEAIIEAGKILAIKGRVIPVTTDEMRLCAKDKSGDEVEGEHLIEEYLWDEMADLDRLWLADDCIIHPLADEAIRNADLVVIAPGSIFTSIIPNLLVKGMTKALQETSGNVVYVANLMTERGQTDSYYVQDFTAALQEYMEGATVDCVIYNTENPTPDLLDRYKKEMERIPVSLDPENPVVSYSLVGSEILSTEPPIIAANDALAKTRTLIRHDSAKLANVLNNLVNA
jgi:uncharacterized cofD-like protein